MPYPMSWDNNCIYPLRLLWRWKRLIIIKLEHSVCHIISAQVMMAFKIFIRKGTYRNRSYHDMCYIVTEQRWCGHLENLYPSSFSILGYRHVLLCTKASSVRVMNVMLYMFHGGKKSSRKYAASSLQACEIWLRHSGPSLETLIDLGA